MMRLQFTVLMLFTVFVVSTIPITLSYEEITETLNQPAGDFIVPSWVKNNAGWWASDQIGDDSFVSGLQWLISNDIITLPPTEQGVGDGENIIPRWIKSTAGWWADDEIHDITFVAAIKYLINEGIMIVMEPKVEEEKCNFKGFQVACSDVKEVEEIKEFHILVNGHGCSHCTSFAFVGDKYHFQIETFDEYRGNHIDGVTIYAQIISKDGEPRHDFGSIITEDGTYRNSITIPNLDWYADNILSVTAEYNGIEKTIEKKFEVFKEKSGKSVNYNTAGAGDCSLVGPIGLLSTNTTHGSALTSPQDIAFSKNGRQMFVVDRDGNEIFQYSLTGPYCISTLRSSHVMSTASQENNVGGLAFNHDGTRMFVTGTTGDDINIYTLKTPYYLSSIQSSVGRFDISSQEDAPEGIVFDRTGKKMFVVGTGGQEINQYNLNSTYVPQSAHQKTMKSFSVSSQETKPTGLAFNHDGTKMFVSGTNSDRIQQYSLSVPYEINTASFISSFSVSTQESNVRGLWFDGSGYRMFIVGSNGDEINVYKLRVAFDVSTASPP